MARESNGSAPKHYVPLATQPLEIREHALAQIDTHPIFERDMEP